MKVLTCKQELCNGCGACENSCSKTFFKEEDRNKSAIRIVNNFNTFQAKHCIQCGECINMCTATAIYRDKNGVVRIDKSRCVGCLGCIGFCSYLTMYYIENQNEPFKCIACGVCVKSCPNSALEIAESK